MALDPTEYYQSTRGGLEFEEENFIAVEVQDLTPSISADCPDLLLRRWSDASRAEYVEGQEFALGKIARQRPSTRSWARWRSTTRSPPLRSSTSSRSRCSARP